MISPGVLSPWPGYPEIPIFLDTRADHDSPESQRSSATTFDTSHSSVSPVSPLNIPHFIKVTPPSRSANYSSKTPNRASTHQFDRQYVQQQPKKTSKRFLSPVDQSEKPPVPWKDDIPHTITHDTPIPQKHPNVSQFRFGDFPSSHKGEKGCPPYVSPAVSGLGITGSYGTVPSGVYPSHERAESSNNFVQRIEDTLWRYSFSGNVFKRWMLESISWAISALCMAGIVGVLLRLQNKKSSEWPLSSAGITLNTYVAVLSRIASAALLLPVSEALGQLKWSWFFQGESKKMWDFEMFDNASRGPWGSFQLLLRTKGRKLAALGAAIVLFALALDPFFQQLLDFPDRWILKGNSTVPRAVRYEPIFPKLLTGGVYETGLADTVIQEVTNAYFFDNGTEVVPSGNGTRPEIPVSCPTSNCTWEPYETLGFCSQCEDISDLLTYDCLYTRIDWLTNLTGSGTEDTYPNGTACGYFLNATSEMPILMSGYALPGQGFDQEVLLMRTLPLTDNNLRHTLYGNGSIHFKEYRNTIIDALIVTAPDGVNSVKRHDKPNAYECVLSWCVKTLQSSYSEAKYKESVLKTYLNTTEGPSPWNTTEVETPFGGAWYTEYNSDIIIDAPAPETQSEKYGLSNETACTTVYPFDDFFPSFYTKSNMSETPLLRYMTWKAELAPKQRVLDTNSWVINTTAQMEKLATSLTNTIRSYEGHETVVGNAYERENYIDVRFQWLVLPVGLLLFSAIFLIATVVRTSREKEHVGVWKTSAVATLLYGLPDEIQKRMALSVSGGGTPRATAKELKVQLQPGKGWRVSGNWFSPIADKVRRHQPPPGWI